MSEVLSEGTLVTKRDGSKEEFRASKINKVLDWAVEGISNVSASEIAVHTELQICEGITSREIHEILIKSAEGLISLENPNYQIVASRLLNYQLRKDVWGGKNPPKLYDLLLKNIEFGVYDKDILNLFTKEDINKFDEWINHDRDYEFNFCGIKQLISKYLVKNRKTKIVYETPQFAFMLIAMISFSNYKQKNRNKYIRRAYNSYSKRKINLPTPLMAGVRTPVRQYASCCLIDTDDSIDSLIASNGAIIKATSQRFGIGVNMGRIRGIGAEIRNGEVTHTGVIPFLKHIESAVKSCHQNGIRGGGATVNFPIWHYEIEDILQLKNNAGTDSNRVRNLDYCIHFSKLFYERWLKNETVTLFSPHEVKDMYETYGTDSFDALYEKYEKDSSIKMKKVVQMRDLMTTFIKERSETQRIYLMNIDHVNMAGAWKRKVNMTNLCVEVNHPTTPLKSLDDPEGEIGICVLAAINLLEVGSDAELEKVCDLTVRMLDNIIDYQSYFVPAAERFAKNKRSLGIGVTNLAALLAKNNLKYSDTETPNFIDELMEKIQFFLLKASNTLAKEVGPCKDFSESVYSDGILPIDKYNKNVDEIVTRKPSMPWEDLRKEIKEHGLRHCTMSALMPAESSSVIQSSTNGIEPIRSFLVHKGGKSEGVPVIAPHYSSWKDRYELAFDLKDNIGLLNIQAAFQKWVDMSISGNVYYNPEHYPKEKIPDTKVIKEIFHAYKMGIKTLYYNTNYDQDDQTIKEDTSQGNCDSGACAI